MSGTREFGISLERILVAIAGFVGGFASTLASNGSSVTLPALEFLGLPEHVANGTNRLSVVALGLAGTIHFYREGLVDWREGVRIAALIALGTSVGSLAAVELSNRVLDAVVVAGLLLVLGLLLARPGHWLQGKERSDRSAPSRLPLTSPSASTQAWSSSAPASSFSPP